MGAQRIALCLIRGTAFFAP